MSEHTKIQWCDHTFNPWEGCTKVSPGCANCYAEALVDKRYGRVKWGKGNPRRRMSAATWKLPLKWNRDAEKAHSAAVDIIVAQGGGAPMPPLAPRVFCASLADWLDEEVPIEWLADLLVLIHTTSKLDWLLLTKRPENFQVRVLMAGMHLMGYRDGDPIGDGAPKALASATEEVIESILGWSKCETFPANVWVGTSVEDQARADERIPHLISIPSRVRFLSCEPLLGPVDIEEHLEDMLDGGYVLGSAPIQWVIVGGESGITARPFDIAWAQSLVDQCKSAGAACFVKQLGAHPITENANLHDWPDDVRLASKDGGFAAATIVISDRKGGDMAEWPEELRVREFPRQEVYA